MRFLGDVVDIEGYDVMPLDLTMDVGRDVAQRED